MPINGYDRTGQATADDLDVPDFLKPDWVSGKSPRTIPGEVIPQPAEPDEDDIAPGVIEYRPVRTPVLYRTGSAAMVVASRTGRVVGLSARHGWTAGGWFGHGLRSATVLGYRYVRGHDHIEVIGGMTSGADWSKIERTRVKRWKTLGWIVGGTVVADLAAWWALVNYGGMSALDWSWAVAPGTEALAAGLALTVYGKYRLQAGLAPGQIVDPDDVDDGEEPFPLAWCKGPDDVVGCVGRAFAAEGLDTRRIDFAVQHAWGRQLDIDLKGCTPAKVNDVLAALDSHFDLPQGGTMVEPDQQRSSHITLRLVESNPFADVPRPQIHNPRSLSVHDTVAMGRAMDGGTFALTFDGFCALVIGAMGAGKTLGALRTIAEALTACVDAVCWDLDPLKGGLAEFGDLMEVRARGPEECEEALGRALSYVTARSKVMPRIGMGDRWYATEEHPDLYLFIDEYLQLSPRGKELAIKILRTGRQYGIYLIMAGQEATADSLGDAIAGVVPYRIAMACRFEDVRIIFGPGKGAQGWRPDRMEPSVGELANDAGQSFVMGGGFIRAIRYQFNQYGRDEIVRAVPDRLEAGVNRMDSDTLLEAGQALASGDQVASLASRLEALAERGGSEDADVVAMLLRLFERHEVKFLPTEVIVKAGIAADGIALQTLLVRLVPLAKSDRQAWAGKPQVRGWERGIAEAAANALLAPS